MNGKLISHSVVAAAIPYDASGGISSDNVQDAIAELDSDKQPIDADLTAIAAIAGTGVAVRTAADTWTTRSIAATAPIAITNGNGVSGNPTLSHATSGVGAGSYGSETQTPVVTVNATGHVTSVTLVDSKPSNLVYFENVNTSTTTTTSGTFASIGVTYTPPAGTYFVTLTVGLGSNVSGIDNSSEIAIAVGGTVESDSVRRAGITLSGISLASAAIRSAASTTAVVTVNGSQAIAGFWRRASGSTTHSSYIKHLTLIRVQ